MIDVRESYIKQCKTSRLITQGVQVNKGRENKGNKAKKYLILKPIFTCCHNQNWTKYGDPSRKFVNYHKIFRGISHGYRMAMDNDVRNHILCKTTFGVRPGE